MASNSGANPCRLVNFMRAPDSFNDMNSWSRGVSYISRPAKTWDDTIWPSGFIHLHSLGTWARQSLVDFLRYRNPSTKNGFDNQTARWPTMNTSRQASSCLSLISIRSSSYYTNPRVLQSHRSNPQSLSTAGRPARLKPICTPHINLIQLSQSNLAVLCHNSSPETDRLLLRIHDSVVCNVMPQWRFHSQG